MTVVRNRSLASRKLRFLGVSAALAVLVGTAGYFFSRETKGSLQLVMVGAVFLGLVVFMQAVEHGWSWLFGEYGERKVLNTLRGLPDDYAAITNFVVPGTKRGDVDLMVLGPFGVLVVEIKQFGARYACDGDKWVNIKENGFRKRINSPSRQLRRNAKAVEEHLRGLGESATVQRVLVIADGSDVEIVNASVPIIRRKELKGYIERLPEGIQCEAMLV